MVSSLRKVTRTGARSMNIKQAILAIILATLTTAAHAQNKKDWDTCRLGRDIEQSDAACVRVIKDRATPTNRRAFAHSVRSVHFNIKEDYKGMETELTEAMKLAPKDSMYVGSRCYARYKLRKYADALADCNLALTIDPTSTHALNNRAQLYEVQKNPAAILDRQAIVRIHSNYDDWFKLCNTQAIMKEFQDALASCDEALLLKSDEYRALLVRGFINLNLNGLDQAIDDFTASLPAEHLRAFALYGRSVAKRKKRDIAGAETDLFEALKYTKDPETHSGLYWTPK